jgi:hypothetical protein
MLQESQPLQGPRRRKKVEGEEEKKEEEKGRSKLKA